MCLGEQNSVAGGLEQIQLHNFFTQGLDGQVSVQLTTTPAQKIVPSSKKFGSTGSIIRNRYTVLKTLGEGAQGKVKLANDSLTGEEVAIKLVSASKAKNVAIVKREIELLSRAQGHNNIMGLIESFEEEGYFVMVMERLSGDLFDLIDEVEYLPMEVAKRVLKKLLQCISHCHSKGVFHRDIKPENILLTATRYSELDIKLCDFGLATNDLGLCDTVCGSDAYAAPEVLDEIDYVPAPCDLWSAGVVMYNIITSFSPWGSAVMLDDVFNKYVYSPSEFWAWTRKWSPVQISAEFEDLFSALCHPDPSKRPSAAKALAHPFFSS